MAVKCTIINIPSTGNAHFLITLVRVSVGEKKGASLQHVIALNKHHKIDIRVLQVHHSVKGSVCVRLSVCPTDCVRACACEKCLPSRSDATSPSKPAPIWNKTQKKTSGPLLSAWGKTDPLAIPQHSYFPSARYKITKIRGRKTLASYTVLFF